MNHGFVILAQNTKTTDYVACAEALAKNIRRIMPDQKVSIITDNTCDANLFDQVIKLPHGDLAIDSNWKLQNDWQVYHATPYEHTIKLEADIYLPRSIDHWWNILSSRELGICTTIRNFRNEISTVTAYRKFFIENRLPQTYNAITYFRKSKLAEQFFALVRFIFENWNQVRTQLRYCPDEIPTTDAVYAVAAVNIGVEHCCLNTQDISMIHMKHMVNGLIQDDWTKELIYEIHPETFRIATHAQLYPVHYHVKQFSNVLNKAFKHG